MDYNKTGLVVALQEVEFAKDFHYFITLQLEGNTEKRRTDVSAQVKNPVFTENVFRIPLPTFKIDIQSRLIFQAHVVTDREENMGNDLETKGQARLLGECVLELGPLTEALTDISQTGVRQLLKFTRIQNGKQVTVGRFIVQLKVVSGEEMPLDDTQKHIAQKLDQEIFHALPHSQMKKDFGWRVKVDVRCGVDMPLNRTTSSSLPTTFVETEWTLYDGQPPDDLNLKYTEVVDSNRHPIWNKEFYVYNPPGNQQKEGYLYLCVRDRHVVDPLDIIYFPIKSMTPFVPYNLELISSVQEFEARGSIFVSLTLEMKDKESFTDTLIDVVVHKALYDPLPLRSSRMMIAMTTNSFQPKEIKYARVDLKGPTNVAKIIEEQTDTHRRVFLSSIMNIPPTEVDSTYKACAVFTIRRSMLESGLQFYIVGRDDTKGSLHGMPNFSVGHSDVVDDQLQKLYFDKESDISLVPITWEKDSSLYPAFNTTKCRLDVGVYPFPEDRPISESNKSRSRIEGDDEHPGGHDDFRMGNNEPMPLVSNEEKERNMVMISQQIQNLQQFVNSKASDKEKWDILSKELAQKQELIHRLIKESDDKTESLKITGAEIVDLRRQIKMLQSENAILRKRLAQEEQIEVASVVTKEIARMGVEELRAKIVKLAQAYRDERVRNEEFEKSLKSAQKEIAQTRQLSAELENMTKKHTDGAKKLMTLQNEISKVQLYKDTIKKQEKVIAKLEKLMESTLKDTQKARGALVELEQLKTENLNLQKQIKEMAFGAAGEEGEVEKYKSECRKLERIVVELKEELKSKRPQTSYGNDWEREKMELEIKLNKSNTRVEALQEEMTENARNYAKEISKLKIIISEKQAMLDNLANQGY